MTDTLPDSAPLFQKLSKGRLLVWAGTMVVVGLVFPLYLACKRMGVIGGEYTIPANLRDIDLNSYLMAAGIFSGLLFVSALLVPKIFRKIRAGKTADFLAMLIGCGIFGLIALNGIVAGLLLENGYYFIPFEALGVVGLILAYPRFAEQESAFKPALAVPSLPMDAQGPKGLGGWLIGPALWLFVWFFATALGVIATFRSFVPATWHAILPYSKFVIGFESGVQVALLVFSLVVAKLFFGKRKTAVKFMIYFYVAVLVMALLDLLLSFFLDPQSKKIAFPVATLFLTRTAIGCAIWIPYFLRSKRVKNTFTR